MAKEPLRGRVGDVASNETELRRGSGDIVASKETDGRLLSGVFCSKDRGGEPTDIKAGCAAVATASTAWGVTIGTLSAGLEMEPRRRGDRILKTCARVRVFEIPTVSSSRGVLSRAGSVSGPAHQQSSHEGSLGHHFKTGRLLLRDAGSSPSRKSQFPGGSRAFGRVGACARLESPAVRREVHCVRRVGCQSRARARAAAKIG